MLHALVDLLWWATQGRRATHVSCRSDEGRAVIEIDSRRRCSEEELQSLFAPMLTSGADRRGSWSPVSLQLTRMVVERYGGSIRWQAGADGTKLRVTLPGDAPHAPDT